MFVSFLFPFPLRNTPAPYLWVFYKQLTSFGVNQIAFIGSPDYFQLKQHEADHRDELSDAMREYFGYRVPSQRELETLIKFEIAHDVFDELNQSIPSPNRAWQLLLSDPYGPLQTAIEQALQQAVQQFDLEAVITWCNCPSLTAAAQKFDLPVIHNELGALRAPHFRPTMYFDRQGVNGNTEACLRLQRLREEVQETPIRLLQREELLSFMLQEPFQWLPENSASTDRLFELGLPLQVEDDSNLLAFADGTTNYDLIMTARRFYKRDEVLIRKHPSGRLRYGPDLGEIDNSSCSLDFIRRCKRVATINSSVGLESLLLGRPTWILGDSPFQHLARTALGPPEPTVTTLDDDTLLALNHAILGYLAPWELVFNAEYYRWRLGDPSETEILDFHVQYYLAQQAFPAGTDVTSGTLGQRLTAQHLRRVSLQLDAVSRALSQERAQLEQTALQLQLRNEQLQQQAELLEQKNELLRQQGEQLHQQQQQLPGQLRRANELETHIALQTQQLMQQADQLIQQSELLAVQQTKLRRRDEQLACSATQLLHVSQELDTCHGRLDEIFRSRAWRLLMRCFAARSWIMSKRQSIWRLISATFRIVAELCTAPPRSVKHSERLDDEVQREVQQPSAPDVEHSKAA